MNAKLATIDKQLKSAERKGDIATANAFKQERASMLRGPLKKQSQLHADMELKYGRNRNSTSSYQRSPASAPMVGSKLPSSSNTAGDRSLASRSDFDNSLDETLGMIDLGLDQLLNQADDMKNSIERSDNNLDTMAVLMDKTGENVARATERTRAHNQRNRGWFG